MATKKEQPIMRTPNFLKFYVTNVRGGLTDQDIRFELLNEQIEDNKGDWCYLSEAMMILSPVGAKRLLNRLKECVDVYEKDNGAIEVKETREKMIK